MLSASEFWNWFIQNNSQYVFINLIETETERDRLLSELQKKLHEYSEGVFFEIGGKSDTHLELIITAAGDTQYFDKVIELVEQAPAHNDWKIIAFKPPREGDFQIQIGNDVFDSKEIYFQPLTNSSMPNALGVKIAFKNYDPAREKELFQVAFIVLDTVLGEKSCALDIKHIELTGPPSPDEYLPISELRSYLDLFKKHTT